MSGYTNVPGWVAAVAVAVAVALIVFVAIPAAKDAQHHESGFPSGHARCY